MKRGGSGARVCKRQKLGYEDFKFRRQDTYIKHPSSR